ncbi:MAG: LarC family nickel insertion protein [Desulfovibrio sp.]
MIERTMYLDCRSGVSGDMLLAALSSACPDPEAAILAVRDELISMGVSGLTLKLERVRISGLVSWRAIVDWPEKQPLRTIADIEAIICKSQRDDSLIDQMMTTIKLLGTAESVVHGLPLDQIHFHEIGAVDTLVDVVGTHLLLRELGVVAVIASPVNLGSGTVRMAHGVFPVPAPAVAELSKNLLVYGSNLGMEAATPTGVALIRSLAKQQGELPEGRVVSVGCGCGTRSSDAVPTMLRAFLLEQESVLFQNNGANLCQS